ncbi:Mitochondrial import inner membrane translocase subunit TIM44 [Hypsibius exemplaris]|uniref:Mitochondrial import inner membrane translocase subunit TIM44 n=1 Tax=Hypsibius exemplaris TaxID=2072580 RepID=A0A1W0WJS2_HYPEX|nr:Mitochondrial import inner membrane translocase subunit TIM44 [Hypsibius exemplaris]
MAQLRRGYSRLIGTGLPSHHRSSLFPATVIPPRLFDHEPLRIVGGTFDFPAYNCSQARAYASPPRGFFGSLLNNIRQEFGKNKEMKESLKKFREEADKLEQSDALKEARKKFQAIESETSRGSDALRKGLTGLKDKISETIEDVQKTDIGKNIGKIAQQAKDAAETVVKQGEQLGGARAVKKISRSVKAVTAEMERNTLERPYKSPVKLRKRAEFSTMTPEGETEPEKTFSANEEATGVELHKDSKWFQSWESFKNDNAYVNKMFEFKMKYDESENPLVRASRAVTDKVSDLMGGLFSKTELSEVLTEILKIDPTFDKEDFLRQCHDEIIPNLLEAMTKGDLEILRDWCYDGPFSVLSTPIKQAAAMGYHFDSRILDVNNIDLVAAKMMEQGPVLVITFQSQAIMCVRDKAGKIVEGDSEKVMRTTYVWVLCRDQTILDPSAAWRLIDLSANTVEQWL